jgi:hypothetical protein
MVRSLLLLKGALMALFSYAQVHLISPSPALIELT